MHGQTTMWRLSRRELRVLLLAATITLVCLLAAKGLRAILWRGEFSVRDAPQVLGVPARLDLNTAREYELRLLPGIGEKTARAIVASRDQDGPYERLEDLTRVRGIGPKTVERLRPHLMCVPPGGGEE